ncbi:transglutaminase N-terminal domain-containing protein [Synechococcus sp. RSCCF101]|uniref:transglutaminase N-terminal domain-containing protein n=1 Tax=Synechococcus sp. RSCCF101 TaxID=2511069 RepID=UPI001CDA08EF|nr:transglutaminase N-terminal domain-containing protein [Synechococcus sp. RSCCF101]
MRFQIDHVTTYRYDRPVTLSPHLLRLQPRTDPTQRVLNALLTLDPSPTRCIETIDLDGNTVTRVLFPDTPLTSLRVQMRCEVETLRSNPFDFLLEPWATRLPLQASAPLQQQLLPYLGGGRRTFQRWTRWRCNWLMSSGTRRPLTPWPSSGN